ncbi:uncharacterized protein TrAFT101_000588 [Trichoderma asperellum]|uniref:uncharacterized protein n=1 Tax=Trichoderma asperellum TaxID=101201 RepID=UPI0033204D85|nr:hypothetical protein TrAFT101_000588 [Trichoderma asperellum]
MAHLEASDRELNDNTPARGNPIHVSDYRGIEPDTARSSSTSIRAYEHIAAADAQPPNDARRASFRAPELLSRLQLVSLWCL